MGGAVADVGPVSRGVPLGEPHLLVFNDPGKAHILESVHFLLRHAVPPPHGVL